VVWKSLNGAIAGGCMMAANFLSAIVVARLLGIAPTGVVSYVLWLSAMIAPLSDLGLAATVERFGSELRGKGAHKQAEQLSSKLIKILIVPLCLVVGLMVMITVSPNGWKILGLPVSGYQNGSSERFIPLLLAAYTVIQVLGTYSYAWLRASQRFSQTARLAAASLLIQLCAVVFGSLSFGVNGAITGYLLGMILPAIVVIKPMLRSSGGSNVDRRLVRYARYAWAGNVANAFIWSRVEIFFLAHYWGAEPVAAFAVALTLSNLAIQGPSLLTGAALALLSERHGRTDREGMRTIYLSGTRMLAVLVFPACLGMAAIMPVLVPSIYGSAFVSAIPAATILVSVGIVTVPSGMAIYLIYALERNDIGFIASLSGAALTVIAGFALVPQFGVFGAVVARSVVQILVVAIIVWFVVHRLGYSLPSAELVRIFIAALISACVARLCLVANAHPATLPAAISAAAAAYVVALRALSALPVSDIALLSNFARDLPRPLSWLAVPLVRFVGQPGVQ
jgi:O-antigen/teichoic acid export membrane protein